MNSPGNLSTRQTVTPKLDLAEDVLRTPLSSTHSQSLAPSLSSAPSSTPSSTPSSAGLPQKDPLTGLYERDYLIQALNQALTKNPQAKVSATLGLLQLENFYEIRSWVGKSEADFLLNDIAVLLRSTLPEKVLLCRFPQYEFGILLLDDCSINAELITDRVKQALLSAISTSIPAQLELKCGVGLALLDNTIPSAEVLFARARHNLSLCLYHGGSHTQLLPASPKLALEQLSRILRQGEFKLSFQAIASLVEDGLQHYEVRCGFSDSEPATRALFETAASNALGEEIDRRVISQALTLLKLPAADNLRLTISLSHNSLVSPRFSHWLESKFENFPELGRQLVFQLSEIDVLIAQHHIGSFCEKLDSLNIKLCVSHFGCTTDPFRYLSLLRAQFIKLDVALIEKIHVNAQRHQQLVSMVSGLHSADFKVIAPMVERIELLPLLFSAGINFVQGHWLHTPSSSMRFKFLQRENLEFL